jgi:hypothetical protein
MIALRLFDPGRNPTSWTEIIQPGQYAAFAKTVDTGAPCDAEGRPFPSIEVATCLLFDGLTEAESFCRQQVDRASAVRFEIFDATGRANPPLLVIVHPTKAAQLEGNPRGMRLRSRFAIILLIVAAVSFWYNFRNGLSVQIFPTLIGINLVVVAARLFQLNKSYAHAERARKERLAEHQRQGRITNPPAARS